MRWNQAFSAAQLKAKAARKLQRAFQASLLRQIDTESLPPTVGWITMNNQTGKTFDNARRAETQAGSLRYPFPRVRGSKNL